MVKIFYEKIDGKYVPVSWYDTYVMDALPIGNHLIMVHKNGLIRKCNVEPALAPMIAAGRYAVDDLARLLVDAMTLRPEYTPLTQEQMDAWKALAAAFGKEKCALQYNSAHDAATAVISTLQDHAMELLSHPAVKNAYDEFLLVCKLAKESK